MARKIGWEDQLGRRLKLRDLHVFSTVVQRGSMAKAAAQLGVSQPAVSEVIADLEHALGAPLLDRSPRGVELTAYGRALLKRTHAAFDELKQGIRDIEFLTDPTAGEVTVGCTDSVAAAVLAPVFQQFFHKFPNVVLHLHRLVTANLELPELRERTVDVVLGRVLMPMAHPDDDLIVEILIDDHLVVTAGMQSRWARRRKIDLAELLGEPWILTPPNGRAHALMVEAFQARGLAMPKVCLTTYSLHLRALMVATGPFITALPAFTVRLDAGQPTLKALPVDLPARSWPVAIVTLKNRSLSPVAQLFIDHVRDFTASLVAQAQSETRSDINA